MDFRIVHRLDFNWIKLSSLHERNENLFLASELGGLGLEPVEVSGIGKIDILSLHGQKPLVQFQINERSLRSIVDLFPDDRDGGMKLTISEQNDHTHPKVPSNCLCSLFPRGKDLKGKFEDIELVLEDSPEDINKIDDPVVLDEIFRILGITSRLLSIAQSDDFFRSLDSARTRQETIQKHFRGFGNF